MKEDKLSLDTEQVEELAEVCLRIERLFEYPQDIEWCINEGDLWILQSRPITSLEGDNE